MSSLTTQLGAPLGSASTGVTLMPAEGACLYDVEAAQLIGWIETWGRSRIMLRLSSLTPE